MSTATEIDGVLVQWGERLFYPRNRIVRSTSTPRLSGSGLIVSETPVPGAVMDKGQELFLVFEPAS